MNTPTQTAAKAILPAWTSGLWPAPTEPQVQPRTASRPERLIVFEPMLESDLDAVQAVESQAYTGWTFGELPELMETLAGRMARIDSSYRPGKPFVKVKFHDFTQTTLEQAGAGRDLGSYQLMLTQAFNRGGKPVRLLGVGVRLEDLRGGFEQLDLFSR